MNKNISFLILKVIFFIILRVNFLLALSPQSALNSNWLWKEKHYQLNKPLNFTGVDSSSDSFEILLKEFRDFSAFSLRVFESNLIPEFIIENERLKLNYNTPSRHVQALIDKNGNITVKVGINLNVVQNTNRESSDILYDAVELAKDEFETAAAKAQGKIFHSIIRFFGLSEDEFQKESVVSVSVDKELNIAPRGFQFYEVRISLPSEFQESDFKGHIFVKSTKITQNGLGDVYVLSPGRIKDGNISFILKSDVDQIVINDIYTIDEDGNLEDLISPDRGWIAEVRKEGSENIESVSKRDYQQKNVVDIKNFPKVTTAPMADWTDLAWRVASKAPVTYSEYLKIGFLFHQTDNDPMNMYRPDSEDWKGLHRAEFSSLENLFVLQLLGPHRCATDEEYDRLFGSPEKIEKTMKKAAKIFERFGVPMLDLNCVCFAAKIKNYGGGAALQDSVVNAEAAFRGLASSVSIPVSVKLKKLKENDRTKEYIAAAKRSGVKAIIMQPRTLEEKYRPETMDFEYLSNVVELASPEMIVIGNGDVTTPEKAKNMIDQTGVHSVMVGRGSIGNPEVFPIIEEYLNNDKNVLNVTPANRLCNAWELIKWYAWYYGEKQGIDMVKRHLTGVIKLVFSDNQQIDSGQYTRQIREADSLENMRNVFLGITMSIKADTGYLSPGRPASEIPAKNITNFSS